MSFECSPMVRKTWIQSQVASYERLLKWYLMLPCLTLSNIRYVSRVKLSNPRKGVAPSPTPQCSSYWKGSLLVALDYGRQLYLLLQKLVIILHWIKIGNWNTTLNVIFFLVGVVFGFVFFFFFFSEKWKKSFRKYEGLISSNYKKKLIQEIFFF